MTPKKSPKQRALEAFDTIIANYCAGEGLDTAAIEMIRQALQDDDWNSDMSAAPRNGTPILIWSYYLPQEDIRRDLREDPIKSDFGAVYLVVCEVGEGEEFKLADETGPHFYFVHSATHWMPLPPPPGAQK